MQMYAGGTINPLALYLSKWKCIWTELESFQIKQSKLIAVLDCTKYLDASGIIFSLSIITISGKLLQPSDLNSWLPIAAATKL